MNQEDKEQIVHHVGMSIKGHMKCALQAMNQVYKEMGKVDSDFRRYVIFMKDGTEKMLDAPEMVKLALSKENKNILLSLNFWIHTTGREHFFCCEVASIQGIQTSFVVKINAKPPEHDDWVDPSVPGGYLEKYFHDRKVYVGQAIQSAEAALVKRENNLDYDAGHWNANTKAADFGAN